MTADRNSSSKEYVHQMIVKASSFGEESFVDLASYSAVSDLLNDLIETRSKGFRGVVLTAIVGLYLDSTYDPIKSFYDCHPRAIFEQGIFFALNESQIPCGKSDPLNVAKNTYILDENWAKGKRPQSAAMAAVKFLRVLMSAHGPERQSLIDFFFYRLVKYAEQHNSYQIYSPPLDFIGNQEYAAKLISFALKYPESGTIPQFIIGLLLDQLFSASTNTVCGYLESVFGTNTTAQKPADIWIEADGKVVTMFEVTLKHVDLKRLEDCYQALCDRQLLDVPISFICRMGKDVSQLELLDGSHAIHKGKSIDFIDFSSFIQTIFGLLTTSRIQEINGRLVDFIRDPSRQMTTKQGWTNIFST